MMGAYTEEASLSNKTDLEIALEMMAEAWGKQSGYTFFPTIRGDAATKAERIQSYREGKAWRWPAEREEIRRWLEGQRDDDVYWCPVLFEYPRRRGDLAMDERCLWADLDEVDPRTLTDHEPSVAWETSPGRYQALWLVGPGADMQGASWPGNENQRMTKAIGADSSGWDTTQLLRIPGWVNHKIEHRDERGKPPPARGLVWPRWRSRRRYYLDDFEDLPNIPKVEGTDSVLEGVVDDVDIKRLWTEIRLKLKPATRQIYLARQSSGDRSERLWGLEKDLAGAGLNAAQIVALVRGTVWNKYEGRQDEFRRLVIEANKAVALADQEARDERLKRAKGDEMGEVIDESTGQRPELTDFMVLLANAKAPRWMVQEIWTEGACGFIAGQPKLHKSWLALDLALSVSTGMPFLDQFRVNEPGPVMYIQEEDPVNELKRRFDKMWEAKRADRMVNEDGDIFWLPATDMMEPDMRAMVQGGMVISDPDWQSWLDEELEMGFNDKPYRLVVLDPLLMMLGDVEENKGAVMTEQIFKPLKQISRKHQVALCVVHHMRKGANEGRGGQMMLGSVANHAWSQDALYLSYGDKGEVEVERESKSSSYLKFKITGVTKSKRWNPTITDVRGLWDDDDQKPSPLKDEVGERRSRKETEGSSSSSTSGHESSLSNEEMRIVKALSGNLISHSTGKAKTTLTALELARVTTKPLNDTKRTLTRMCRKGLIKHVTMGNYRLTQPEERTPS